MSTELTDKIVNRLKNPTESRTVNAPMHASKAKLQTRAELAKKYPTILLVDREHFKLHLLKNLKIVKTYGVSVGRIGLETPAGTYSITDRQVNPAIRRVAHNAPAAPLRAPQASLGIDRRPIRHGRCLGLREHARSASWTASASTAPTSRARSVPPPRTAASA